MLQTLRYNQQIHFIKTSRNKFGQNPIISNQKKDRYIWWHRLLPTHH